MTASRPVRDSGVLGWRLVRFPRQVVDDLCAPDRMFAFFTLVAASTVLAVRLTADGHRLPSLVLAGFGGAMWLSPTYAIPVRLILGPGRPPMLAGSTARRRASASLMAAGSGRKRSATRWQAACLQAPRQSRKPD